MRFTPHTDDDVRAMLAMIGAGSLDDLVAHVPAQLRQRATLRLEPGIDEQAVRAELASLAAANARPEAPVFLGAGAYPHFIPAAVEQLAGRAELAEVPYRDDGTTELPADSLLKRASCLVVGYPNVFGAIEDLERTATAVHGAGALVVSATTEALALPLLRTPGGAGVDIAVAEGQSLGLPLAYGGPGLGLFASRQSFVRSLPGRLVGETVDALGRRGYVLTLATREQHIRRERATSNICTNHGLCALQATVFLCLMGKQGLRELAARNVRKRHYTRDLVLPTGGCRERFAAPFFYEFVV